MTTRKSRFIPFVVAIGICACTAFTLGFGAWYLIGKNPASAASKPSKVLAENASSPGSADARPPNSAPDAPLKNAAPSNGASESAPPPGTVFVAGGIVEVGGTDSKTPA